MSEVYSFSLPQLLLFFLVLLRMSAFVVAWPVFGVPNVTAVVKILFALVLAMVVFPTLNFSHAQYVDVQQNLILMCVREAAIGLLMGYMARFFFYTFQIAGDLMSMSMELSSAQLFNPALGGQSTPLDQFYVILASLFYLAVNGHHYLLIGLVESFQIVPLSSHLLNVGEFVNFSILMKEVLIMGIQFAAPVMISILVINLVMGVIGKTVPQMNVLVESFPINILVGFLILMVTLPLMFSQMGDFLQLTTSQVFQMVKTF